MLQVESFDDVFPGVDLTDRIRPSPSTQRLIRVRRAARLVVPRTFLDWEQCEALEAFKAAGLTPCARNAAWFTQELNLVPYRTITVSDAQGNIRHFGYPLPHPLAGLSARSLRQPAPEHQAP